MAEKKDAALFLLTPYAGSDVLFRLTPDDAPKKKRRTRASLQASNRPFFIEGPAVISFSGGRTSAEMTRRILDAHDGELPDDVFVDFTNTGKEREETLVFVNECSLRWNVPITWLERTPGPHRDDIDEPHQRFRVVTFETASRNGEPFDDIIRERGMVPRPRIRFCTEELKLRVMQNAMRARGYERLCSPNPPATRFEEHALASGNTRRLFPKHRDRT